MILTEDEAVARLESPMNLINRLRSASASPISIPTIPAPSANEIMDDIENKIKFGAVKTKAVNIMSEALDELRMKLPEVSRPEKLAAVAAEMNKIINGQQKNEDNSTRVGQIVIYAPKIVSEEIFEVVDARD